MKTVEFKMEVKSDLQTILNIEGKFIIKFNSLIPLQESSENFPYSFSSDNNTQSEVYLSKYVTVEALTFEDKFYFLDGPVIIYFKSELLFPSLPWGFEKQEDVPWRLGGFLGKYTGLQGERLVRQPSVIYRKHQFPFINSASLNEHPWYAVELVNELKNLILDNSLALTVVASGSHREGTSQKWRFVNINNSE
jgi:hypothetical protein